jgi:aminoglycoside phosphotransferase (APT) family kinase protein
VVAGWAGTPAVRRLLDAEPVVSHGDLSPEEVFVTDDGIRVIDWQRPVLGPPGLDLVGLLRGLGHDPRRECDAALVALDRFVLLRWAVVAADDLLPTLPPDVPASWTALALRDLAP